MSDDVTPSTSTTPTPITMREALDELTFIERLTKRDMDAAKLLGEAEVRYLVDAYYIAQEDRKRTAAQVRALTTITEAHPHAEPSIIVNWLRSQNDTIEGQIKRVLDAYTQQHIMGPWMRDVFGIGPVLSAGLLAHIYMGLWCAVCHGHDEEDCQRRQNNPKLKLSEHTYQPVESLPTVGHIWAFAGIAGKDQKPWGKNQKRPYNAKLKVLQWKVGQSFMWFSYNGKCYYGQEYRRRKEYEIARNVPGGWNAAEVERRLNDKMRKPTEDAMKYLSQGILPPAAMDGRARRYATKKFLAHMHNVWFEKKFGRPAPLPYPIDILGHAHYEPPPV
jgi:hypothetical protein